MPNQVLQKQGSPITWGDTEQTPTEVLSLSALASGNGRAGEEHDFEAVHALRYRIELECSFGAAPTEGKTVDVYWASSDDGTDYDGEATGIDAAYNNEHQLPRLHWVGSLVVSNITTVLRQSWVFILPGRYGFPVIHNPTATGQAFTTSTSAHTVTMTPLIDEIQ